MTKKEKELQELLERYLPPLLQGLQKTPVPDLFVGSGLFLILVGIIRIFEKQEIIRSRTRWAKICGFFFLIIGLIMDVGILNFPSCTYSQISGWQYILVLITRKLSNTSVPAIFTGSGLLIIIISIIGVFGEREIRSSQIKSGLLFGFLLLLPLGVLLYVEPFLPMNTVILQDSLNIPFNEGNGSIKTCQSYSGLVTITVSGTALTSKDDIVDAFYLYSTPNHKHLTQFTLWINGKPIDDYVHSVTKNIPYKNNHIYKFVINVPKGVITFGVGDGLAVNKQGYFTITVSEGKN